MSSDVVSEEELQKKGIKYTKTEQENSYLVEKGEQDKLKDYTYRAFGTPVAVVIDAAIVILVVGTIALNPEEALNIFFSSHHSKQKDEKNDSKKKR